MDRTKLKDIIRTLEITLDTLKAEVYSDVDSYKSEEEYSSRPLDCEHAAELIDIARNNPDKSEQLEITRVVVAHTDPMCFGDAKAD